MDSWHELNIRLQMESLISTREGMIADNQQCIYLGEAMAYESDSFQVNSMEFIRLLEELRS